MAEPPDTRASLLLRLRDPSDREAWAEFVHLYGPVVYDHARRHGCQDADAADVVQEVLCAVSGGAGRLTYDPARGRFRAWLYTLTMHKIADCLNRQKRPGRGSGDSAVQALLEQCPAPPDGEEDWNREYERRLYVRAAELVRGQVEEATWKAFWLTAVEARSGDEAAAALGMEVGSVYVYRNRVMKKLKAMVRRLDGA